MPRVCKAIDEQDECPRRQAHRLASAYPVGGPPQRVAERRLQTLCARDVAPASAITARTTHQSISTTGAWKLTVRGNGVCRRPKSSRDAWPSRAGRSASTGNVQRVAGDVRGLVAGQEER